MLSQSGRLVRLEVIQISDQAVIHYHLEELSESEFHMGVYT